MNMSKTFALYTALLSFLLASLATAQNAKTSEPVLPYTPSLDATAMDKSIDPCVDLYHYSCGGWQKKNPIPPEPASLKFVPEHNFRVARDSGAARERPAIITTLLPR